MLTKVLLWNLEFRIELYLVKQIPENTDRVVSRLILTMVLLRNLELRIQITGLIMTKLFLLNLELEIEFYLVKQIPKNTDRDVSGLIMTMV